MSELLHDFHFMRPWWLLALLALPLVWQWLSKARSSAGAWRSAIDAHLLEHVLVHAEQRAASHWPRWLALAVWLLACLALAGPAWQRLPQPLYRNAAARVFVLELSASMYAQDIKPSRYERARFKLADMLAHGGDMQTALIAFAGDAFVVAPLTDDVNTVSNLLDALDPSVMPVVGNDTARALDMAVDLFKQTGAKQGEIVLLADGVSSDAVAAARRAHAAGLRVSVLGIGSAQGAPVPLPQGGFLKSSAGDIVLPRLDASALADVARAGAGRYAEVAADAADIDALLDDKPAASAAQIDSTQASNTRYLDRGPWLLLLLLPLAALGFRRGWMMALPLLLCAHAPDARAFSWTDLWQRPDQQAQAELDAGHAAQAQALAHAPDLRATAAYRAHDFATASEDFAHADGADAQYNRGNALARLGRYPEAIAAYDSALKLAPQMTDAAANKQAIEAWLKQQQQQQQQKKNQQAAQDHQGHEQDKSGQGSSSDQQEAEQKQDAGQGQQDQQAQADAKPGADGKPQDGKQGAKPADDAQQQAGDDSRSGKEPDAQQAAGKDAEEKTQQQFKDSMDQAMKKQDKADTAQKPQPVRLGASSDGSAKNEQQQAVEQLIERVPDDPGGLLRRKFQLEFQMRQQHADARSGGGG